MTDAYSSAEFLGADGATRVHKCCLLAIEAEVLALTATDAESREAYWTLKEQWNLFADEMEQHAQISVSATRA
jgi:hypothetical protein